MKPEELRKKANEDAARLARSFVRQAVAGSLRTAEGQATLESEVKVFFDEQVRPWLRQLQSLTTVKS